MVFSHHWVFPTKILYFGIFGLLSVGDTLLHLPHLLHIHCKHPAITDELTTTSLSPRDEELWVTMFDRWWFSDTTMDCHALLWSRYFTDFISSALCFLVAIVNTIACNTVISVLLDSPLYTLCTRPLHNPAATWFVDCKVILLKTRQEQADLLPDLIVKSKMILYWIWTN